MLGPRSHSWTSLQRWLVIPAVVVSVAAFGALVYSYERYHRGAGEDALVGTWQEYNPGELPDGGSFYRFNLDHTYEVFDKHFLFEKGTWYAGGDFVYFGRPFDYAASGAVVFWRIEDFSPAQIRVRYNAGRSIITYRRVSSTSPPASNQTMQPTAHPCTALLLMTNTHSFQASLVGVSGGLSCSR